MSVHRHQTTEGSDAVWRRPDRWPTLDAAEIHVWRVAASAMPDTDRLHSYLSDDERRRAARFHFRDDSERFAIARGVLRAILGRYVGCDPAALRFAYGAKGKPGISGLPGVPGLSFNLSHSGGIALIAVGLDRPVGVDVERVRAIDALELAGFAFSPEDVEVLRTLHGLARDRAFLALWTRRESRLKASGEGLSALHAIGAPGDWSVVDLDAGEGYVAALAVHGRGWTPCCWSANRALT